MRVKVILNAQLRKLAGQSSVSIVVDSAASAEQIIESAALHGNLPLAQSLVNENQVARSSILVFLDNELVTKGRPLQLNEQSEITLATLISGG